MTRKKPWNRVSLPVYASTTGTQENCNMHICTYVSAVSMQPKRYAVAFYKNTRSLELVQQYPVFTLQLMAQDQYALVRLLGQQSGHSIDKVRRLQKRNLLRNWQQRPALTDALAFLELKTLHSLDAGDHWLLLCDVMQYHNNRESPVLTTSYLGEKGVIRI